MTMQKRGLEAPSEELFRRTATEVLGLHPHSEFVSEVAKRRQEMLDEVEGDKQRFREVE